MNKNNEILEANALRIPSIVESYKVVPKGLDPAYVKQLIRMYEKTRVLGKTFTCNYRDFPPDRIQYERRTGLINQHTLGYLGDKCSCGDYKFVPNKI